MQDAINRFVRHAQALVVRLVLLKVLAAFGIGDAAEIKPSEPRSKRRTAKMRNSC